MTDENLSNLSGWLGSRSLLGKLAVLNGWLTEEQLRPCVENDEDDARLASRLISRGLLTSDQVAALLKEKNRMEEMEALGQLPASVDRVIRILNRYAITEKLGEGGAGVVWKAWDTRLQRWVAIKEARIESRTAQERILREAQAAARLRHSNLVHVLEVGQHEGGAFIVMDFIEGKRLSECRLDPRASSALLNEICDAVHYMHSNGVLHRDIKPENILVDASGKGYLADFGLAKLEGSRHLTVEGTVMGTPQYMAPEQASGKHSLIGPQTDVYGLGATLYFVASGRAPFAGETSIESLFQKLMSEAPAQPSRINPDVSKELEAIIARAMEKHPGDRYADAAELSADLRRFLRGETIHARPIGAITRGVKWVRRNQRLAFALALAAGGASAAAGVGIYHVMSQQRESAYQKAYHEGIESWMRAVNFTRGAAVDRAGLAREAGQAEKSFEAASKEAPRRPEPLLMRGRCLMLLGLPQDAEKSWTQALAIEPSFGPALVERGKYFLETYVQLRLPTTVRVSGRTVKFLTADPSHEGWREKGERDLERARAGLEPSTLKYLEGALAFGRHRFKEAADALREYAARNSWDAAAYTLLATACYLSGGFRDAEEAFTHALDLQPRAYRFKGRGDVRYCSGKFADAIEDYKEALRSDPENPWTICNRGLAYQGLKKYAEAVADFSRAVQIDPKFSRAYNCRGTARIELLETAAAREDFERAVELSPFYAEAYNNLGSVLVMETRVEDGLREYDMAIQIDPEYQEAYVNRGLARAAKGDNDGSISDFERALTFDPQNPELQYHVARVWKAKGDSAKALEIMKRALELGASDWPLRNRAGQLLREWTR